MHFRLSEPLPPLCGTQFQKHCYRVYRLHGYASEPHMKTRRSACRVRISAKTSTVLTIFMISLSRSRIISKL